MFLTMKTIAWDQTRLGFYSPSRQDFLWPAEKVVVSKCQKCERTTGLLDLDGCTCGIYSSPNKQCLSEYGKYPNSIYVILNNYGSCDIWTGPADIPNTYVVRSWGAQIIGIAAPSQGEKNIEQRLMTSFLACDKFSVEAYREHVLRQMLWQNWYDTASIDITNAVEVSK